ncbi:MAG: glutamate racemase [Armatimonadota bacterium]
MIGLLDSGIGGLTIASELRRLSPGIGFAYVADAAHFPYGNRSAAEILEWCDGMARWLVERHGIDVLVLACNTATAAGIDILRERWNLPIVAVEPAIKPAAARSGSGRIGVLATPRTVASGRIERLVRTHAEGVDVLTQGCAGLAERIEAHWPELAPLREPLRAWLAPMLDAGVDTVVLGCTHYPLARPLVEEIVGPGVAVIDSGEAVARRILAVAGDPKPGDAVLLSTGDTSVLERLGGTITGARIPVGRLRWSEGRLIEDA